MPSDKKPEPGKKNAQGSLELLFSAPPAMAAVPVAALQQSPTVPVAAKPGSVVAPVPSVAANEAAVTVARTYKVSELVRLAGRTIEARYSDVWVEGEISGYRPQSSGHGYFTLKDGEAVLPAVMWRSSLSRLRFRLVDGLHVRAHGRLTIYPAQGKFQIDLDLLEPAGLGALQLAFEQRKRKLAEEGLFDEARKRRLPFLPRRIGIATSATGAAVRDIIRVIESRGPARLLVASCLVQGDEAPADIVRALAALQQVADVDLIILGRGGGSVEDLWAFNDERVARAIAACSVPVISAVGHEVDFTIADFVADKRAATPSQAAEIAVPVHRELVLGLRDVSLRLLRAGRRNVTEARLALDGRADAISALLQRKIAEDRRRLAELESRLRAQHPSARLGRDRALLVALSRRLERPLPDRIARAHRTLDPLRSRVFAAMQQAIDRDRRTFSPLASRLAASVALSLSLRRNHFASLAGTLDALSPLRVLDRGYGLVFGPGGRLVTRPSELTTGDRIELRFSRGTIEATVERSVEMPIDPNSDPAHEPSGSGGRKTDR